MFQRSLGENTCYTRSNVFPVTKKIFGVILSPKQQRKYCKDFFPESFYSFLGGSQILKFIYFVAFSQYMNFTGSYKKFQGRILYNIFVAIVVETMTPKRHFEICNLTHSVLEQIQIKCSYPDQILPPHESLNPIGLISARIKIPHGGNFLLIRMQNCFCSSKAQFFEKSMQRDPPEGYKLSCCGSLWSR